MSNEHPSVPVSRFQLTLKQLCIDVENLFECRSTRFEFAQDVFFAAALFYVVHDAQTSWLPGKPWPFWVLSWLLFGWTAFWTILHVVRRFHDLGRTGGLFWAVAIPIWAAGRIVDLFHVVEKGHAAWWAWVLLALFCSWSFWLIIQLFFRRGTVGPNGYDGRDFYRQAEIR